MKAGKADHEENKYNIRNLNEGKQYYFRVSAENPQGISPPLATIDPVVPRKEPGNYCY